ncbi:unnamed protein product [Caretta caretta]
MEDWRAAPVAKQSMAAQALLIAWSPTNHITFSPVCSDLLQMDFYHLVSGKQTELSSDKSASKPERRM